MRVSYYKYSHRGTENTEKGIVKNKMRTSGKLYFNGKLDAEGAIKLNTPKDTKFGIAYVPDAGAAGVTPVIGTLDEVVVFNVALVSENGIKSLMRGLDTIIAVSPSGKLTITWGRIKNHE
jgi:hypothetical protein